MFALRTSRTRLAAAAVTTVIAALSLTACNDGTGTADEGAAPTSTPSPTSSASGGSTSLTDSANTAASPAPTGSTGSGSVTRTPGAGASASKASGQGGTSSSSAGKPVTCEGSHTKTVAAPLTRPVNHMLLTVTNTGNRTCFLYGYPSVQFTDAQSEPPVIEESQPQAVVTLEPGQSGYASVSLSATDGSAEGGRTAKDLSVYFYGRSMSESVGRAAHPALPAKGVYIDDSIKVTYWQQAMNDAIDW